MTDISPEVLSKFAELMKVIGGSPSHNSTFLDYLKGVAELLSAIAWPSAILFCAIFFRQPLISFLRNVNSVKLFGAELSRKIDSQIEQSARETQAKSETELRSGPSPSELGRAMVVKSLAAEADTGVIAMQAKAFAAEYQQLRDSMASGDERTRAMEVVVSKMRTIGQAFFPIRHEFAASPVPGKRLVVIACLEVSPDYEMLDWLAERVRSEVPFLQYHALVAMVIAAQADAAKDHLRAFEAAVEKLNQLDFHGDQSRMGTLEEIKDALKQLKSKTN
jgi:hypothetical protein